MFLREFAQIRLHLGPLRVGSFSVTRTGKLRDGVERAFMPGWRPSRFFAREPRPASSLIANRSIRAFLCAISLFLALFLRIGNAKRRAALALLQSMRQLMSEKALAACARWLITVLSKRDVLPHRVGFRINCLRGLSGTRVRMHPDQTKIVSKSSFHESARRGIEGLALRADHLMNNLGHRSLRRDPVVTGPTLQLLAPGRSLGRSHVRGWNGWTTDL
jgi:hypothetical protein